MKIIVDVMSGDNAPLELLKGVDQAAAELSDSEFIIVGNKNEIGKIAAANGIDITRFEIVHAESVIYMDDDPILAIRGKKDSSMSVGFKALSKGEVDAFVSAGNTGALITGATLIVRRISGINRAAIASVLPLSVWLSCWVCCWALSSSLAL